MATVNNNINSITKIVDSYIDKFPDMKSSDMASSILNDHPDIELSQQYLGIIILERKSAERNEIDKDPNSDLEDIQVNVDSDERYTVIDNSYVWVSRHCGKISIPVDQMDRIFYEYSRFGLDLTQEQTRRKHNMSISEWNSLKSAMFLYKNSNIFSPYTENNTPLNQLNEMIGEKIQSKYEDKSRMVEEEYNKATLKNYNKLIKDVHIKHLASDNFLLEFSKLLPKVDKVTINRTPTRDNDIVELLSVVADLHIGARVEGLTITPDYGIQTVINRLDVVASEINKMNSKKNTIAILGDIIESFTGLNHKNSWQQIEYGMIGAKLLKTSVDVLSEFFNKINNLNKIIIIGGNHDRITSSKEEDSRNQVAELISYYIKEKYAGIIEVDYNSMITTHEIDNVRFIMAHGDKRIIGAKNNHSAILNYGKVDKFNLILTGHLHSRSTVQDYAKYRHVQCPSIFSGNDYSNDNGWNARPGFIQIYQHMDTGLPVIIDKPLI